jgi:NTE family protein
MTTCSGTPPERTVLVLQGGGAIGAYQLGVAEALEDSGIRPDWVIGTSIGAINGAIIAGNPPEDRIARLAAFWERTSRPSLADAFGWAPALAGAWRRAEATVAGVPGLYAPRAGPGAAPYDTAPMRASLGALVDFERLNAGAPRFTVGAVNVRSGAMRYFDTAEARIGPEHVMASAALGPAFPAVEIEGEPYWDGGLYSNTPIEAVFSDPRRCSAVIFAIQLWQPDGPAPDDYAAAMARTREIRFASRAEANLAHQAELHHLRHVIRELERRMPEKLRDTAEVQALAAWGCTTTMHIIRLVAPRLAGECGMRELDFSAGALRARRDAGRLAALRMIARAPWTKPVDPAIGVMVHDDDAP